MLEVWLNRLERLRRIAPTVFHSFGRVNYHRGDYWDAAEELYEKLPLIGSLMYWLK